MTTRNLSWLEHIQSENKDFINKITPSSLPAQRTPGSRAVITCMDPRINLEAIGIPQFQPDGGFDDSTRIIRTIGGMVEERSLIIGCFLAGIHEITVLMHTDCGCCVAFNKIDTIIERMEDSIDPQKLESYKAGIGEPFKDNLRRRLKVFQNPYEAVREEVALIKSLPYAPEKLVVHGMVYVLETGKVDLVVDGYSLET